MEIKDIHKIVLADAVLSIIKDYKESIEDGMSNYRKELAKINAFDDILANVQWYEDKEGEL